MDRLSEIRARCERATPGPWEAKTNRHPQCNGEPWGWISGATGRITWSGNLGKTNAAFIANAREDIPFLLAEVERLQGKLQDQEYQILLDAMEQSRDEATARAEKAEAAQKALVGEYDYYADRSQKWENAAKEWAARAEKAEAALSDMRFAYVNKDPGTPHQFEKDALKAAADILGKWTPKEGE